MPEKMCDGCEAQKAVCYHNTPNWRICLCNGCCAHCVEEPCYSIETGEKMGTFSIEYYQGYDAYYAGNQFCPYKTKTPQAAEWLRGWREAKRRSVRSEHN